MSNDNIEIKVLSVNVSKEKGTIKKAVDKIRLNENGVEGDAHAGTWHRQVSMLGADSITKFEAQAGRKINFGEFAENITTEGMSLYTTNPLDIFESDQIILEVTQIGKSCHGDSCAIFREVGNCVMPKEGIFCRVLKGDVLEAGATLQYKPRIFRTMVITLSDRASKGEYEDRSGPRTRELLSGYFNEINWKNEFEYHVIPDQEEQLRGLMKSAIDKGFDFIFTTGGTGIGPKDITVETIQPLLDKEVPGIMEMIRMKYGAEKPNALISRSVAGVAGSSLIFTLPGSVKAVNEYIAEITKSLKHLVLMLHEIDAH